MIKETRVKETMIKETKKLLKYAIPCNDFPPLVHDGFDNKGTKRSGFSSIKEIICNHKSPCCGLIELYARLGLHRYNFLQGKNYQFRWVQKYNHKKTFSFSTYYITLDAMDPETSLVQSFQTTVQEPGDDTLILTCNVARLRAETKLARLPPGEFFPANPYKLEWPGENPFENKKRYYMVKDPELQDNEWIRLYLELAVATTNMKCKDQDLSKLKIVKVAIDTSKDLKNERLNAKDVVLFISYQDLSKARVGKYVDRFAIVRRYYGERNYNERNGHGYFDVVGHNRSSENLAKKWKDQRARRVINRRLGILNPWRLSNPRCKAYKYYAGVGSMFLSQYGAKN